MQQQLLDRLCMQWHWPGTRTTHLVLLLPLGDGVQASTSLSAVSGVALLAMVMATMTCISVLLVGSATPVCRARYCTPMARCHGGTQYHCGIDDTYHNGEPLWRGHLTAAIKSGHRYIDHLVQVGVPCFLVGVELKMGVQLASCVSTLLHWTALGPHAYEQRLLFWASRCMQRLCCGMYCCLVQSQPVVVKLVCRTVEREFFSWHLVRMFHLYMAACPIAAIFLLE